MSGSADKTLRVWDARLGVCLRRFSGHAGSIRTVLIIDALSRVYSGSYDTTARSVCPPLPPFLVFGTPQRFYIKLEVLLVLPFLYFTSMFVESFQFPFFQRTDVFSPSYSVLGIYERDSVFWCIADTRQRLRAWPRLSRQACWRLDLMMGQHVFGAWPRRSV